jgi:hypothetical protein
MARRFPVRLPAPGQIVEHVSRFNLTTREKLAVAITGAFGVVIGLSWNDTVKLLVERILATLGIANGQNIWIRLAGSSLTTLIAVLVILVFSRWAKKDEGKAEAKPGEPRKESPAALAANAPAPKQEEKPKA